MSGWRTRSPESIQDLPKTSFNCCVTRTKVVRFDNSAKANWGAEALNTGMQAALFLGLLLL